MSELQFELVSPEKLLISKPVAMVTVPGGEGDYGVLVGHAPLITTVRPGVIDVYAENETAISDRIFVAGGFAEVTGERCTVLAEEAISVSELDRHALERQVSDLTEDANLAKTDAERVACEARLEIARAKLAAAPHHHHHDHQH